MPAVRIALLGAALAFAPFMPAHAQQVDAQRLKSMAEGLGYTAKVLSDSGEALKFDVTVVTESYTTPLLLEVSPSGRFIWVSANLGDEEVDGDLALQLLHLNADVQPTSFWMTQDGHLKIGMAIDNRAVTAEYLDFVLKKVSSDVEATGDYWEVTDE